MRKIRLLLAAFALVGTAFAVGLSPVMAQEIVVDEGEDQEVVVEEEEDQGDVAPAEVLAPDIVVLFDEEDNPFYCLSVDANADGVSELVCLPQTATVETATDEGGNPFSCSSVDINGDGVSEFVCVPQTTTDDTATLQTTTDDTATVDTATDAEEAAEEAAEE